MIVSCPFCRQRYEVGPELVGRNVNCTNCGRDFTVAAEPGEAAAGSGETGRRASSGKKKRVLITVTIVVVLLALAGAGAAAYFLWLSDGASLGFVRAAEKSKAKPEGASDADGGAVREFKKEFLKTASNKDEVKLEWKCACVNPGNDMFFGVAELRLKDKNGGVKTFFGKVAGKREGGKYEFKALNAGNDPSAYAKADWEKCCALEKKLRDELYADRLNEIKQKTEHVKNELKRIPVPEITADGGDFPDPDGIQRLEKQQRDYSIKVLDVLINARSELLKWTLIKIEERNFYSLLFSDTRDKEAELKKAEKLFSAQEEAAKKRIEQLEGSLNKLKRQMLRARVLAHQAVMAMVDGAIADYKRRHDGKLPSKDAVDSYEDHVRKHLEELIEAFKNIRESQRRIAAFGTPTSDRGRIELNELEKELQRHIRAFKDSYNELRLGIPCGDRYSRRRRRDESTEDGHDPKKCGGSSLPPEHIMVDLRLPEAAKLDPSSFSKREDIPASVLKAYLDEDPEVVKLVRFGLPDDLAELAKEEPPKENDPAAKEREREEEKKKIRVLDIVNGNAGKIKWSPRRMVMVPCGHCNGRGGFSDLIPNPNYNPHTNEGATYIRVTRKCAFCRGARRVRVISTYKRASLPPEVLKDIRENLAAGGGSFCGFNIGADFKRELAGKSFYGVRKRLLVEPTPFGENWYFPGNHRYGSVKLTVLTQQFGILTQVRLFTADGELADSLGKQTLPVFVVDVQALNKLPFSKSGTLMFNPVGEGGDTNRSGRENTGGDDDGDAPGNDGPKCRVFVIHAVHPNILTVDYPKLGTEEFPCRWISRPDDNTP